VMSIQRGNTRGVYVLCPPIMTPPPMTLHVIGYIFPSWLSSALEGGSEVSCEE
jgi:hypothetical protein